MTLSQVALLPKHVAIMVDGNGRWATEKGAVKNGGATKGLEALKDVVNRSHSSRCRNINNFCVQYHENWERPEI